MEELEYKKHFVETLLDLIRVSMDEVKTDRERFMQNYRTKYVSSVEEYRKDTLIWIGLIASLLGILSGFSDKLDFIKLHLIQILYLLLGDIVVSLIVITFFTVYRNWMANHFTLIENGYLLSILRHNILLGFISMASLDIGPVSLYQYYLFKQFALILIGSRDELYVSLITAGQSKLVWKQDRTHFLYRGFLLEQVMMREYMRYKSYENQFKNLSLMGLLNAQCSFINRYEGRIVVKNIRSKSAHSNKFPLVLPI